MRHGTDSRSVYRRVFYKNNAFLAAFYTKKVSLYRQHGTDSRPVCRRVNSVFLVAFYTKKGLFNGDAGQIQDQNIGEFSTETVSF